jgi:hypothetical protein
MSQTLIQQYYDFCFNKVQNYLRSGVQDADLTALFESIFTVDIGGKADKVAGAVNGHFAALDGTGNLVDSLLSPSDFIRAGSQFDSRYIRKDADDTYDTTLHQIVFSISGTSPFTLDIVGDPMPVMSDFNAGLLNGHPSSDFVLHGTTEFDTRYYTKSEITAYLAGKLPVISAGGAGTFNVVLAAVDGLTVLDSGVALQDLALLSTSSLANYTTTSDLNTALGNKMNLHGGSTYVAGMLPKYNGTDNNVISSGVNITDLATNASLAGYIPIVSTPTAGNFPLIDTGGVLKNSALNAGSFAPYSHISSGDHDSRYYTQTQLTNYSTGLKLHPKSYIESDTYYIVGSAGSLIAGSPSTNGYIILRINGTDLKFMTTA